MGLRGPQRARAGGYPSCRADLARPHSRAVTLVQLYALDSGMGAATLVQLYTLDSGMGAATLVQLYTLDSEAAEPTWPGRTAALQH